MNEIQKQKGLILLEIKVKKGNRKLGLNGISINNLGNVLFSYYENNENNSRFDCYSEYDNALDLVSSKYRLALSKPNDYFYKYHKNNYICQ